MIRTLVSLAFIIAGLIVIYLDAMAVLDAGKSHAWPSTQGTLRVTQGAYRKTLSYQYTVKGITYESDHVIHGEMGNKNPSSDWQRFSELATGQQVEVFYQPWNPRRSVLARELDPRARFNILFGCAFLLMGVFLFLIFPRLRARRQELGVPDET